MADIFDQANDVAQGMLDQHLAAQADKAASAPKVTPIGYCRNPWCCEEFPAGDQRLYCDGRCATQARKRNN